MAPWKSVFCDCREGIWFYLEHITMLRESLVTAQKEKQPSNAEMF